MILENQETFEATSIDQWKAAVEKELKGLNFQDTLVKRDEVEELEFQKFETQSSSEGKVFFDFQRDSNDWLIHCTIEVKDEKAANKEALHLLNLGANCLTFQLQKKDIEPTLLFNNIGLDYITTQCEAFHDTQKESIEQYWKTSCKKPIVWISEFPLETPNSIEIATVRTFKIQQTGANAVQEIAYALAIGHELLLKGTKNIQFEMGIGSNYLIEIGKFKAFKHVWNVLTREYAIDCKTSLFACSTFINKSLKDPYTNLLRQTTEAMSAVLGGVDGLQLMPFDHYSAGADRTLSKRMAINIQHLLKEESYLQYVKNPLEGSFMHTKLTEQMIEKSWGLFKEINAANGIFSEDGKAILYHRISATREKRIERVKNGKQILIGINKFENPDAKAYEWLQIPSYFGLDALILENI